MEKTPTPSTFTTDSRKQSYHIHDLLWEDAEDYHLYKGPKKSKTNYRIHPKSRPTSFTYVLLNVLGSSLGNILRFPAMAYLYGGGKFLVVYFIVLIFVIKPIFYLEVAMGQFTGKISGRWWSACPAFRGIAVGQLIASIAMVSYYGAFSSFALLYLIQSFNIEIPWIKCAEIKDMKSCIDSNITKPASKGKYSYSDLFFRERYLKEKTNFIKDISWPDTGLITYLAIVWIFICALLIRGVKATGSYAYMGATLPFILLSFLAIKVYELPGADKALKYLFDFDTSALEDAEVWYMAAVQALFSLNASVGVASFLSSQRNFRHRLNRNVCLITLLDCILLILACTVVFATLGSLAHVTKKEVKTKSVYKGGIEMAVIIYTDALSKASKTPEGISVFFLLVLTIVGIGCTAVVMQSIMSTVWELMPRVPDKIMAPAFAALGFALGAIYLSPTGMSILQLVDHYLAGEIMLHMALYEVAAITFIYGLEKFCKDMTFMTRRKIHVYWRLCLGLVAPGLLIKIFVEYYLEGGWKEEYKGIKYAKSVIDICFKIQFLGEVMIGLWLVLALFSFCIARIRKKPKKCIIFPSDDHGPGEATLKKEWKRFYAGLKRCSWAEMKYPPQMASYPFKVVLGTLHDDVFR